MDLYSQFYYFYNFFVFNDTATTEIYTLSLHDALPISVEGGARMLRVIADGQRADIGVLVETGQSPVLLHEPQATWLGTFVRRDRKSTRLNSSHANISYAVFCLKKKILSILIKYYLYFH